MSDEARVPMTKQGFEALRGELDRLKRVERPKNVREIEEARAHGDISENAEFHAAKERQSHIAGQIAMTEDKLARAQVIDPAGQTPGPRPLRHHGPARRHGNVREKSVTGLWEEDERGSVPRRDLSDFTRRTSPDQSRSRRRSQGEGPKGNSCSGDPWESQSNSILSGTGVQGHGPKALRFVGQILDSDTPQVHSPVAQLVEQAAVNRWVVGSSPTRGARKNEARRPSKAFVPCSFRHSRTICCKVGGTSRHGQADPLARSARASAKQNCRPPSKETTQPTSTFHLRASNLWPRDANSLSYRNSETRPTSRVATTITTRSPGCTRSLPCGTWRTPAR